MPVVQGSARRELYRKLILLLFRETHVLVVCPPEPDDFLHLCPVQVYRAFGFGEIHLGDHGELLRPTSVSAVVYNNRTQLCFDCEPIIRPAIFQIVNI